MVIEREIHVAVPVHFAHGGDPDGLIAVIHIPSDFDIDLFVQVTVTVDQTARQAVAIAVKVEGGIIAVELAGDQAVAVRIDGVQFVNDQVAGEFLDPVGPGIVMAEAGIDDPVVGRIPVIIMDITDIAEVVKGEIPVPAKVRVVPVPGMVVPGHVMIRILPVPVIVMVMPMPVAGRAPVPAVVVVIAGPAVVIVVIAMSTAVIVTAMTAAMVVGTVVIIVVVVSGLRGPDPSTQFKRLILIGG